jgi:diguanylate cyclase (GGDEF)-like protein
MTIPDHIRRFQLPPGTHSQAELHEFVHQARLDGHQEAEAYSLLTLAAAQRERKEYASALDHAQQAEDLFSALKHEAGGALARLQLGAIFFRLGEYPAALDQIYTAMFILERLGDVSGLAAAHANLGTAFAEMKDFSHALRQFRQAEELARDVWPAPRFLTLESNILGALCFLRQDEQAEQMAARLVIQARELGQPMIEGLITGHLADLREIQGRSAEALEQYVLLRELYARHGSTWNVNLAEMKMAQSLAHTDPDAATLMLQRVLAELGGNLHIRGAVHDRLSAIYKRAGQFRQALEHREAQQQILREMAAETTQQRISAARAAQHVRERLEQLEVAASTDHLTGLYNRARFDSELAVALAGRPVSGSPVTVALLDVDHFKKVNDVLGHAAGDEVLRAVAGVLRRAVRTGDTVARYGGEEFALVLPSTPLDVAREVTDRVLDAVRTYDWTALHADLRVTASIGYAEVRHSAEEALSRADAALYAAKRAGRDQGRGDGPHPVG